MNKIYGKSKIINYFKSALRNGALSHLYIFEGAIGVGKKTLAQHLAMLINCKEVSAPCGTCPDCIKQKSGNHPDVIWVQDENSSKKTISVETVRNMLADVYIKPFLSDRKIYIIPDAETLTPQAQNALLKVLEEPPSYITIFLLTSSQNALLKTVLSRGLLIKLDMLSRQEMMEYILENFPDKKAEADVIAAFSSGCPGTANTIAEGNAYFLLRESLYSELSCLTGKRSKCNKIVRIFEKNKNDVTLLLELLLLWFRDVLSLKLAGEEFLINKDYVKELGDFASSVKSSDVTGCASLTQDVLFKITKGSNISLWITDLIIKCWRLLNV